MALLPDLSRRTLVPLCGGLLALSVARAQAPFSVRREPRSGLSFVYLPPGRFLMGSPPGERGRGLDETQHLVVLSRGFWMGQMEVTRAQWQRVMGPRERHPEKPNPFAGDDPRTPMVSISYQEVQAFLRRLEQLAPGQRFRLPTEAEWEYACRAGTVTAFHTGARLDADQARVGSEAPSRDHQAGQAPGNPSPVGTYAPNAWGLYDLHGNAWEWTSDWYGPYPPGDLRDPRGPARGSQKVIRGGSWAFSAASARSACRYQHAPEDWGHSLGVRVVWEPQDP